MFQQSPEAILFEIPPWPTYHTSNFRQFEHDEKHITRISAEYVLLFILEQSLHFTESGRDVEVSAGEWYIQVPGLKQEGRRGSPAPFYYYIHFSACSVPWTLQHISADDGGGGADGARSLVLPVRGTFEPYRMRPWFERLDVVSKQGPLHLFELQSVFLGILNQMSTTEMMSEHPSRRIAHNVINYLAANYNRPLNGNDIAGHFHYSYDYILRLLKKHFGIAPWQYIQSYRIKRAQELLENTDLTVPEIANEIGYNDENVFYKAFRKHTGDAPGIWRKKKRGLD